MDQLDWEKVYNDRAQVGVKILYSIANEVFVREKSKEEVVRPKNFYEETNELLRLMEDISGFKSTITLAQELRNPNCFRVLENLYPEARERFRNSLAAAGISLRHLDGVYMTGCINYLRNSTEVPQYRTEDTFFYWWAAPRIAVYDFEHGMSWADLPPVARFYEKAKYIAGKVAPFVDSGEVGGNELAGKNHSERVAWFSDHCNDGIVSDFVHEMTGIESHEYDLHTFIRFFERYALLGENNAFQQDSNAANVVAFSHRSRGDLLRQIECGFFSTHRYHEFLNLVEHFDVDSIRMTKTGYYYSAKG